MIYLALDTASHLCAAAIYDDSNNKILGEAVEDIGRGHAERLMDVIEKCLGSASLEYSNLDKVICTTGPGSFTGVRVGLSTARGIALGLSIPIIGLSALDALAHEAGSDAPLLTLLDARREEAYALWRGDEISLPTPCAARYDVLAEIFDGKIFDICGSGAAEFLARANQSHPVLHELTAAPIATIARLGARLDEKTATSEPLYLRTPDAKPQKGFALATEA